MHNLDIIIGIELMKVDISTKWQLGEREVTFIVTVPQKHKSLAKNICHSIYKSFVTALKAYNIKIKENTSID